MSWVEKNRKNILALWVTLLLIIAVLSIWLCSIVEIVGNEVFLSSKEVVVEESLIYEEALQLWKSAYVIVILTATAMLVASGMVTVLVPQPHRFLKKVKLKDRSVVFDEEKVTRNDDEVLEESIVVMKNLKRN